MDEKEKAGYCKKGRRQEIWMRKRKRDIVERKKAGEMDEKEKAGYCKKGRSRKWMSKRKCALKAYK